jgi:methylase of polypeptide subunit release factors
MELKLKLSRGTADDFASLAKTKAKYLDWIKRYAAGEPSAYIRGWEEFHSLRFRVDRHTLIPRQDSEIARPVVALYPPSNDANHSFKLSFRLWKKQ